MLAGRKYQDITLKEFHAYESEIIERIGRTGKAEEYEKEYIAIKSHAITNPGFSSWSGLTYLQSCDPESRGTNINDKVEKR